MKYLLSAIVVPIFISGSLLYGITNAVPVSQKENSNSESDYYDRSMPRGRVPDEYIVNFWEADDLNLLTGLPAYIKSQEHRPDTFRNEIFSQYKSKTGGGAMLFGRFNETVLNWIGERVLDKGFVEPNVRIPVAAIRTVHNAPWGLPRLNDEPKLNANKKFDEYTRNWPSHLDDTKLGEGSRIYILDSGVRGSHLDFLNKNQKSRVEDGQNFGKNTGPATTDNTGHGTSVASLAAGLAFGVAKFATIVPYKILEHGVSFDSAPLQEAILTAIDDFAKKGAKVGVINISHSLILEESDGILKAIKHAIERNMHVTIAAGNEGVNPCIQWKEAPEHLILVGATNIRDEKWKKSNFGECVDIYAPGEDVYVAVNRDNTAYTFQSGTSAAAPQAAGVIAIIGASDPELSNSPKKMKERILKSAAKNKITVSKDETKLVLNRILQSPVHAEINLRGGDISPGDYSEKLDNEKDYKKFIEWLAPRSQELQENFS